MDRDRDKMAERILHLTLEIIFRLTGEDYVLVKTSSERCQASGSERWGRPLSPITGPPPHPLIHEDINDQKILELTYKMIELLTGEVPIRCWDVAVYFSMEEWEYLEGHKDLYKDVLMEVPQALTSPVRSSKRTTPERCPCPLLPQDCKQENPDVAYDHQGKDLTHINTTETYVRGDERCKEEIPTDNRTVSFVMGDATTDVAGRGSIAPENFGHCCTGDDCTKISMGRLIFSDFAADNLGITADTCEEQVLIPDTPQDLLRRHLLSDPFQQVLYSASLKTNVQNKSHRRDGEHKIPDIGEKPFSCSECGRCFTMKHHLVAHQLIHTGEKPFSCSECGKCCFTKSRLIIHQRSHTGEKPFSCSECGKCFKLKPDLVRHKRIHTGEKPFSCSECRKCFCNKSDLYRHRRTHTGEKPFSCLICGKCFNRNTHLVRHLKIHTK
ncbi:oocyte zinc finger protein XlCOF8.4-like [Phyllobates terribilis]|uniref:oocyte zinc finger protein XlCOF8.4-like n=1 Tax=Phyllobates terribilis TaxID=111132 RepID=UPI003CCAF3E7